MVECICSSCRNLKGIIDDSGEVAEFQCKFGFPSEQCANCQDEACEETCAHYLSDEEITEMMTVKCKKCGKELSQACSDDDDGEVYCINCFLDNEK